MLQHMRLVVGFYREHQNMLYIFCFVVPSSQEIGMERSVPGDDRGAVIVSTPSTDRLEVTSAAVTPAGRRYFLRNFRDTKPWSSCKQNRSISSVINYIRLCFGVFLQMLTAPLTCLSSCLACIVMKSSPTLTDSSSGEKCFTSR